ncbi:hypothetical protein CAP39_05875 [Sphingomonas sp. IBVSS1]|uniref:Uncharacterized protein n=1 Tax=Sandarakinorhabdus cyanobacteriorum TaxID=1981098 RepID=A0A255Z3G5_9SPHN|nr:hypothetical protein [Sandarakinorhabdus cyanobacteriorum]OSZ70504.1 hypothetical protein CAP39_05875 [Sphingomonas sp. IBVSS1]OYQ35435.1 hypothetical protein CHU93_01650 [Sandarakinorhabdus cyanobacteriorum]
MIFEILGLVTLLGTVAVALRWGGRDERFAAYAFIAATVLSWLLDNDYHGVQMSVLAIDLALLCGLVALALTSDRFWPMYAAAFQLVGTMVHIGSMTETGDFAWAYAVGLVFWSYPVMAALIAGSWLEGRPRRAHGL